MTYFDDLPIEIVSLILRLTDDEYRLDCYYHQHLVKRQLCVYALVNKQFHAVANSLIYSSTTIQNQGQGNKFFTGVTKSKYATGHLVRNLSYHFVRSDTILLQLMPHLPSLSTLTFVDAKRITDTSIQQLPHYCPNLTSLSLQNSIISDQTIYVLAELMERITHLQLYDCPGLTGTIFSALAGCSSRLTKLEIKVAEYTKSDWMTTDETTMVMAASRLNQLMDIKVLGAPPCFVDQLVSALTTTTTTTTRVYQLPFWPHLDRISLDGYGGTIGHDKVVSMIQTRPGLVGFAFFGAKMTDTTLEAIASYLPGIQYIGLNDNQDITAHGVRRLVLQCAQLKDADLCGCNLAASEFPEMVVAPYSTTMNGKLKILDETAMDEIRRRANSDPNEHDNDDEDDDNDDEENSLGDFVSDDGEDEEGDEDYRASDSDIVDDDGEEEMGDEESIHDDVEGVHGVYGQEVIVVDDDNEDRDEDIDFELYLDEIGSQFYEYY